MAVLIKDDQQLKALDDITKMLDEIKTINEKLNQKGKKFSIIVNKKQSIVVDEALCDKIIAILKVQRAKRIKDINTKAQKYRIALDDNDMFVMSDKAISGKSGDSDNPDDSETSEHTEAIQNIGAMIDDINSDDDYDDYIGENNQYTTF